LFQHINPPHFILSNYQNHRNEDYYSAQLNNVQLMWAICHPGYFMKMLAGFDACRQNRPDFSKIKRRRDFFRLK